MLFKVAIVASVIGSTIAVPLSGRALPAPVSAATARTYLSERRFSSLHTTNTYLSSSYFSDGGSRIQLPRLQQGLLQALDY